MGSRPVPYFLLWLPEDIMILHVANARRARIGPRHRTGLGRSPSWLNTPVLSRPREPKDDTKQRTARIRITIVSPSATIPVPTEIGMSLVPRDPRNYSRDLVSTRLEFRIVDIPRHRLDSKSLASDCHSWEFGVVEELNSLVGIPCLRYRLALNQGCSTLR